MKTSKLTSLSGLALVGLALFAGHASALVGRSLAGLPNSLTWNDTDVTPTGATLQATLENYGVGSAPFWLETGANLDVTSGGNGAYSSGVLLKCNDTFVVPATTRPNVTGNTAGDIRLACGAFTTVTASYGEIEDH